MKIKIHCLIALVLSSFLAHGQSGFRLKEGQNSETIRFKFVSNLIVLPIEVNGVRLSFILDTGVNKPILFNLTEQDSVEIRNIEEIYIKGLGKGEAIKAFRSRGNRFKLKNVFSNSQELYAIIDSEINFSPRLGFPVHGIIGYDLFKDFVVEINYRKKKIKLHDPLTYFYKDCKKCETFNLDIIKNKPFIEAFIEMGNYNAEVTLLIDSGSSDALWLFESKAKGLVVPAINFEDFLGRGLSGSIYGKRARVEAFRLGKYTLKDAKVAFPDSLSIQHLTNLGERDGSLGAEILKRFKVIFDYQQHKLTLQKNANFNEPFKYNMSGIELQHNGLRFVKELEGGIRGVVKREDDPTGAVQIYLNKMFKIELHPAFEIAEIRKESPAGEAGLMKGDVILSINGKQAHRYTLQEVAEMLNEKEGKTIRLLVDRKGVQLSFVFTLKELL